ncbi:thermonuclease family protein [Actinokineospora enzanensis]|uniref:thermonuclease family protein n=1 Tax=Actinokineospora enzanensis TaxID=155975 RepID=UPI00036660AF|nr:excalibur calcium-binding domain-containing protein [Actinokineospora enzanensis]
MGKRTAWAATALAATALLAGCGDGRTDAGVAGSAPRTTPTAAEPVTTSATTTTSPAQATATVSDVVDARTVLTSAGRQVVVAGLAAPGECWSGAAFDFARKTLGGQQIQVSDLGAVLLADGRDFAQLAVSQGMAKVVDGTAVLTDAQNAAKNATLGLWGAPCGGLDVLPAPPAPAAPPAPKAPATTVKAAPHTTQAPAPKPATTEPAPAPAAYYKNCDAARAAGAAPLYRGEPGYRSALDRDNDGVACE